MIEKEQIWPLAPATNQLSSDDGETASLGKKIRRRKCIKRCSFIISLLLILAIVIVILILTVFRVKSPEIKLNSFTITQLQQISGTIPNSGVNISVIADISVKNPNVASFKYSNTTTSIYYHGILVGEGRGAPGHAKAQRTIRMNVTVDIITDRLMSNPNLQSDFVSGLLPMDSYSRVGGRVNILNIFKRHVTVTMSCNMTVNISSQGINEQKCKRKVDL